jgi:hypothetical protein
MDTGRLAFASRERMVFIDAEHEACVSGGVPVARRFRWCVRAGVSGMSRRRSALVLDALQMALARRRTANS